MPTILLCDGFLIANDRSCCRQTWRLLQAVGQSKEVAVQFLQLEQNSNSSLGSGTSFSSWAMGTGCSASTAVPESPGGLPLTSHWPPQDLGQAHFYEIQDSPLNSGTQIRVLFVRKMWGNDCVCAASQQCLYLGEKWLTSHSPWHSKPLNQSLVFQGILCPNSLSWEGSSDRSNLGEGFSCHPMNHSRKDHMPPMWRLDHSAGLKMVKQSWSG